MSYMTKSIGNSGSTPKMPVLFLGHGSPLNAIEDNLFSEGFRNLGKTLPEPAAILCISAHWETKGTFVTAMEHPETIHDFGGFPRELYEVQYPAPGSPELAGMISTMVKGTRVEADYKWGFDHGAWSVIRHLFPAANIPLVMLSLDYFQAPQNLYDMAKELTPLRNMGVLIIGSGNMVHNLHMLDWNHLGTDHYAYDWALEAGDKMKKYILKKDHKQLINYRCHGKAFELAIPTPEHYLPLLGVLALQDENDVTDMFNDVTVGGSLLMTSVVFRQS